MLKSLLNNRHIKIASACFGTIVSLFSLFSTTYAWFTAIRTQKVTTNSFAVTAGEEIQIEGYTIYGWDYDSDSPIISDSMMLNAYDAFIPTRNTNNHKYLKASLLFPQGLIANSTLTVSIRCTGDLANEEDDNILATNISNLVQFKYLINSEIDGEYLIDTTSAATIYSDCADEFATGKYDSSLTKFVNISNAESTSVSAGASKQNSVLTQIITFSEAIPEGERKELFIEYDYNVELIDFYESHCGNSSQIERFEGETVTFEADIADIKFGVAH